MLDETTKPARKTAKKAPRIDSLGVFTAAVEAKAKRNAKAKLVGKAPKAKRDAALAKIAASKEIPAPVDSVETLFAEYSASDTGDDNFIRALLQKAFDAGKAAPRARAPRAGGPTKRDIAAALLVRPEGCTSREILDVTGWPAVSVPAIAKASGLVLTQAKDGRVTTYFGKAA